MYPNSVFIMLYKNFYTEIADMIFSNFFFVTTLFVKNYQLNHLFGILKDRRNFLPYLGYIYQQLIITTFLQKTHSEQNIKSG